MSTPSYLVFIGLIHFEKKDQERKILKKVSLAQVDDNDIMEYLRNEQEYERKRNKAQSPFLHRLEQSPEYILVLQPSAMNQASQTLRGLEDHISLHLLTELPEEEWKQRAIKILLTWNLSERKELEEFVKGSEQVEKHFMEFGVFFLVSAVIGYVMILVMKHMI
ncbi:unnamed protein product [Paramecium octaurelia]|uniref:Uncharacterized protein n=1 Tax=Paramecium octaurelia TaxID=43137 RepID=A0A8S1WEB9_PAROT|nr:unnamed protein product [Paramecium octaurelia]